MPNPIIEHIDVNGTTYDLVDSTSGFSKSYKVTITKSGSTYSSDKTYSEISAVIASGDYDFIFASEGDEYFAPLQWNYDGTTDAITFVCLYNEVSDTYGPVDSGNKNIIKKYQIKTDNSVTVFDSTIPPYMSILSYGKSTWKDFIDAYDNNAIVYCRASSNANPASGNQTRMAFMAYVNATPPTNVEFQYYRSVSSHSVSQQGDQVYIYKLDKSAGWSVTAREASVKVNANNGCKGTYSSGTYTVAADLLSTTKLTNSATAATETSNRVYPVALDSASHLAVVVPWTSISGADEVAYEGYQGDITENCNDVEQAIHTLDQAVQGIDGLPSVTSSDNGKILQVVSGVWSAVSIPNANTGSF